MAPLAEALRVNQTLTQLDLDSNNQIADVAPLAEALRVNNVLRVLWLRFNPISSEGKAAIEAAWGGRGNLWI